MWDGGSWRFLGLVGYIGSSGEGFDFFWESIGMLVRREK